METGQGDESAPRAAEPEIPPRVARLLGWLRDAAIAGLALYFLAQLAYAIRHTDRYLFDGYRIARYYVGPALIALAFAGVLWRGSDGLKAQIATYGIAVLSALLLFEIVPSVMARSQDPPSIVDEAIARRAAGERVFPSFTLRAGNRWAKVESREAAILSNVPGAETVLCGGDEGEGETWQSYVADDEGFNNDPGALASEVTVAIVGDSYVHGYCLSRADSLAGQLRGWIPGAAGFGISGNGPLYELEIVQYYLAPRRPPHVVWVFFEGNDLSDLEIESQTPWLLEAIDGPRIAYPHPAKGPTLEAVVAHLESELEELRPPVPIPWAHAFGLLRTSKLLGIHYGRAGGRLDLFERVLARAKREVADWGGTLHLLYLPEIARYQGLFPPAGAMDASKSLVVDVADRLGIPVIDAAAAFDASADPLALFSARYVHLSAEGARAVALLIAERLGYPPASARQDADAETRPAIGPPVRSST